MEKFTNVGTLAGALCEGGVGSAGGIARFKEKQNHRVDDTYGGMVAVTL